MPDPRGGVEGRACCCCECERGFVAIVCSVEEKVCSIPERDPGVLCATPFKVFLGFKDDLKVLSCGFTSLVDSGAAHDRRSDVIRGLGQVLAANKAAKHVLAASQDIVREHGGVVRELAPSL